MNEQTIGTFDSVIFRNGIEEIERVQKCKKTDGDYQQRDPIHHIPRYACRCKEMRRIINMFMANLFNDKYEIKT